VAQIFYSNSIFDKKTYYANKENIYYGTEISVICWLDECFCVRFISGDGQTLDKLFKKDMHV